MVKFRNYIMWSARIWKSRPLVDWPPQSLSIWISTILTLPDLTTKVTYFDDLKKNAFLIDCGCHINCSHTTQLDMCDVYMCQSKRLSPTLVDTCLSRLIHRSIFYNWLVRRNHMISTSQRFETGQRISPFLLLQKRQRSGKLGQSNWYYMLTKTSWTIINCRLMPTKGWC